MNILHVIPSLDPQRGGPMEAVRQLARAAQEWGDRTAVVSTDAPHAAFLQGNPFDAIALGPTANNYGYSPRLVPWLRTHAREFDAVVVNGLWQYCGLAAWRALRRGPVPYFVFTHGMLDPYFKQAFPAKHLKKLLYWTIAEYRVLRDARAVLFTCEEERLLARQSFRRYRAREVVTGLGTAAPSLQRASAMDAFLGAYPQMRGRRLMLFLGRLHEKKGCDLLLSAFADAARRDPRWQLVFAGPCADGLAQRLQAQARALGVTQSICWTGMVEGALKWGALHCAEVFVLPSHQENFGLAVVEALACGTPVLVSNKVNIWREIEADGAGLVEPDTPDGTRALLARWNALDEYARQKMRLRARACFSTRFDIRTVARGFSNRLAELIAEDGRSAAAP